jgi:hypothetical protein
MNIGIRLAGAVSLDFVRDTASFLLHDPFGSPILFGLEYRMPEGTAWTFCSANESDFHKILATSGILHTVIPGCRFGMSNLLCTPLLRRGWPRWFADVETILAATEQEVPFFFAVRVTPDRFETAYHNTPHFHTRWRELWERPRR